MKKFISVLLTLALVLSIAAPTTAMAASDSGEIYVNDWENCYAENCKDGYQTRAERLYNGSIGCYGLKPEGGIGTTATITFTVDVKTAGLYTLTVIATAGSGTYTRKGDVIVNGGEAQTITFMELGWENHTENEIYVQLVAGENEVVLATTPDYDEATVKTPNIYGIRWSLKRAMEVEPTPAPTTAPEPTVAPTEAPKPTEAPSPTVAPTEAPKPTEAPAPTTAPVEKDPVVVEGTEYVVKAGDTLSAIAAAAGVTVKELVEANKIENPDVINVGLKLVIPTVDPKKYIVKKGDTLSAIAKANGCKLDDILKLNTIENPDVIVIGDIIVLP